MDLAATTDGTADPRVVRARALLAGHDWNAEPVSLDELSAEDRAVAKDHGETEPVLLARVLLDHITTAVTDGGLLGDGLSLRSHVGC